MQHRYPGIRSFEAAEQNLFFGRSEEIRSLYAQVKTLNLVVLFSKSGIGKSSLLNAGLVPLLDLEPYIPIKIRLQDTSVGPIESVKNTLLPYLDKDLLQQNTGKGVASAGFWESLRSCRFERYGEPAVPVLIFDQFEEFFEHPAESRRDFVLDLADLVTERLPNRISGHLLSLPLDKRTQADMDWHRPPKIRVVIAIRSDRLSLLDDLSVELPLILHNRFQLKPLQRRQASDAITEPAALTGSHYLTPPFVYKQETLDLILDELKNKDQEIESFQLQLVCQDIEKKVLASKISGKLQPVEIDQYFVSNREDIQSIINNYYEKAIENLPDEMEERARNFIETGLIVAGRRVGVNTQTAKEHYGIDEELLRLLVDSRLVRLENTHLGQSIEVSHDALVEPILQSYEKRRLKIEQEAAEKEMRERELHIEEELKQIAAQEKRDNERRRLRLTTVWACVAMSLALAALYGFLDVREKNKQLETKKLQLEIAENERLVVERELEKTRKNAELEVLKTKVDIYLNARQPDLAMFALDSASRISSDTVFWILKKKNDALRMKQQILSPNQ
jgi:hypothetical protein